MSTVGSAYVIVRAISPSLKKDISKAAESAAKAAAPAIDKVGKDIEKGLGDSTKRAAEKAGKAAAPAAKSAGMQIGEAMADALPGGYTKRAGEGLKRGLRRAISAAGPDKEGNNLGVRLSKGFGKAISDFKIPMPVMLGFLGIPAIGGALHILGAYVGGAIGLIGAIGPAFAAAGGVGAASLLSIAGAAGAVMLALKTASPMLNRFKVAAGAVGKEFSAVGLAVQRTLLPNLGFALAKLTGTIPTLKTGLSGLGSAVGGVAINLANVATSATFLTNIATVFREGGPQIKAYGSAIGSVLQIFGAIAAVAAPFATSFAKVVASFAASAAQATLAGQASGRLGAFMERAVGVASQLGGIVADLGRGLFNTFSAGASSGQTLLDGISKIVAKFAAWSGSMQGQSQLRTFFANALPVIREVNGLIGDVLKAIVTPVATGDNAGVIGFVRSLRTDVLPALSQIGQAASGLGPSLTTLVASIADLVSAMANSGALGAFTATLTTMIDALTKLLSLPVVGDLAGYALAFGGMAKAVDLVLKPIGGLSTVMGPLGGLMFGTSEKMGLFQKAGDAIATKVLPRIIPLLSSLGTAIYGALGPIGLIIAAVVALVAGLIYAYKHSETFRNIVNQLGAAIMSGLGAALNWLKGVWDTVWNGLVAGWNFVRAAFSAGVAFVVGIVQSLSGVINVITQPFQGLVTFFTGVWQLISGIFTGNIDKITSGIANMIGGIVQFFFGMPSRIIQAILPFLPTIWNFFVNTFVQVNLAIANGILAAVHWFAGLPGRAMAAIASLIGRVVSWATSTWTSANARIAAGIAAAISFMAALPGRAMSAIASLPGRIATWATGVWSRVTSAFTTGVSNVVRTAQALPGRVVSAVGNLGSRLMQAGRDLISGFEAGITARLNGLLQTARDLAGKVVGAVKKALDINSPSKKMIPVGMSVGEGMQVGIRKMVQPVGNESQRMAMAAIPDTAARRAISSGAAAAGAGAPGTEAGAVSVMMNVTIDDLAKLSTLAEFLEMIQNARVDARRTQRSGTVTA